MGNKIKKGNKGEKSQYFGKKQDYQEAVSLAQGLKVFEYS